jgi:GT2 family glycosyltransferase
VSLWAEWAGVTVSPVSRRSWQVVKPVPVTDWRVAPADRRCLVAVVSNERMVYRQTAESLVRLGWGGAVARASAAHGFRDISFTWVSRHVRVDDLRNEAVLVAQAAQASHLLFLDADMTWPPDVLERMLAHHDRGIVSGLYFLKAWPNHPVAFSAGRVNLETQRVDYTYAVVEPGRPGLVPQALIGMGCALIPMRVFETLERPWFAYRQDPTGAWTVTEDVAFCQKAAAVGCPIALDASVVCGHVHQERIGPEHYMRSAVESLQLAERMDRQAVPA